VGGYVFSVVAAPAKERGLQSTSVRRALVSTASFEICGRVCAVLKFLRDKSRAPAAILVGAINTYIPGVGARSRVRESRFGVHPEVHEVLDGRNPS
jgi:hypothetical protein